MKSTGPASIGTADRVADLKKEIELYRALSEKYSKQSSQRGILALAFCSLSVAGTVAILTVTILAGLGVFRIDPILVFPYIGLCLLFLLVGLFFFNARHDSKDLALECFSLVEKKEEKLQKLIEKKRAEEELAKKAAVRVVKILPKVPASKAHKAATALRATSSALSLLYKFVIPVASIAALCKSKPKKEKKK